MAEDQRSARPELQQAIYQALKRALWLAVGIYLLFRFVDDLILLLLFFLLSIVLAIALAPPVNWLEERKVPRPLGTILMLVLIACITYGVGALVFPRVAQDMTTLANNLPQYWEQLTSRAEAILSNYPYLQERLEDPNILSRLTEAGTAFLMRIGQTTMDIILLLFGVLVLISIVGYAVAKPRPLLRGMVGALPAHHRDKFARAFVRASEGIQSWVWANVIIGAIEGVAAAIFLSIMGVPGAIAFGAFTFFAELIPQLGGYLMAIPPVLVALAIDPILAIWIVVFYTAMQNVVNTALAPLVRAKTMHIHPVSEIFTVLALLFLYGLVGAIVSAPVVAILKAYYDEFYASRHPPDKEMDHRIERMLKREHQPEEPVASTV